MVKRDFARKLVGKPRLLQDWDTDVEELSSKYWELFLDLLLVAGTSAVANIFMNDLTWKGFGSFLLLYLVLVNGYMLYSPDFTTRFEDTSLLHAALLFPYLMGIATCAVNAGTSPNELRFFCIGALVQRCVLLILHGNVAATIPRAKVYCQYTGALIFLSTVCFLVAIVFPSYALRLLSLVAAFEFNTLWIKRNILPKGSVTPVNIEHMKDRQGCFILVVLGETVVSSIITFKSAQGTGVEGRYYLTSALSFLMIFSFTLLYFHLQPAPQDNAMRKSRSRGILLYQCTILLGASLLCAGVGVKLIVDAVLKGQMLTEDESTVMSLSVGFSMAFLLSIRLSHYGGLETDRNEPTQITHLKNLWWGSLASSVSIPFLLSFVHIEDPLTLILLYSLLISLYCVVESTFTHILSDFLNAERRDELAELGGGKESNRYGATDGVPSTIGSVTSATESIESDLLTEQTN